MSKARKGSLRLAVARLLFRRFQMCSDTQQRSRCSLVRCHHVFLQLTNLETVVSAPYLQLGKYPTWLELFSFCCPCARSKTSTELTEPIGAVRKQTTQRKTRARWAAWDSDFTHRGGMAGRLYLMVFVYVPYVCYVVRH